MNKPRAVISPDDMFQHVLTQHKAEIESPEMSDLGFIVMRGMHEKNLCTQDCLFCKVEASAAAYVISQMEKGKTLS